MCGACLALVIVPLALSLSLSVCLLAFSLCLGVCVWVSVPWPVGIEVLLAESGGEQTHWLAAGTLVAKDANELSGSPVH